MSKKQLSNLDIEIINIKKFYLNLSILYSVIKTIIRKSELSNSTYFLSFIKKKILSI